MSKNIELLAVQWTNKWRGDSTNQTARFQHALLWPPLAVPLSRSLFAPTSTVLTSYHEDVLSHWNKGRARPSQSNNGTAVTTTTTTTTVAFLSSAQWAVVSVGVAWTQISTNTLKCCPLNRWKNVNISYALWRCRADWHSSWSLEINRGMGRRRRSRSRSRNGMNSYLASSTTAGQNVWAPSVRSMSKVMPVLAFLFSFSFLSSIFALQHLLRPTNCELRPATCVLRPSTPSPLDEAIIFIWFIMSSVGRRHLLSSVDSSFLWRQSFRVKYATIRIYRNNK